MHFVILTTVVKMRFYMWTPYSTTVEQNNSLMKTIEYRNRNPRSQHSDFTGSHEKTSSVLFHYRKKNT